MIKGRYLVEIKLRKQKWFLCYSYYPKNNLTVLLKLCWYKSTFVACAKWKLYSFGQSPCRTKWWYYEKFPTNLWLQKYCQRKVLFQRSYETNLQWLHNWPKSLQKSEAIETGLFDSHKFNITVMKVFYYKRKTQSHSI